MGELDEDIKDTFDIWRIVLKDFSLLTYIDKLSFVDIQRLNALIDMENDTEQAVKQYQKQQMEENLNK